MTVYFIVGTAPNLLAANQNETRSHHIKYCFSRFTYVDAWIFNQLADLIGTEIKHLKTILVREVSLSSQTTCTGDNFRATVRK